MILIIFTSGSLLEGFLNVITTMLLGCPLLFYLLDLEDPLRVIIILRSSWWWWYIRVCVGIPIVIIIIVKTFNNPMILLIIVRRPSCCVLFWWPRLQPLHHFVHHCIVAWWLVIAAAGLAVENTENCIKINLMSRCKHWIITNKQGLLYWSVTFDVEWSWRLNINTIETSLYILTN